MPKYIPPNDRIGARCVHHDPVVEVWIFGGRFSPFIWIHDVQRPDGTWCRYLKTHPAPRFIPMQSIPLNIRIAE